MSIPCGPLFSVFQAPRVLRRGALLPRAHGRRAYAAKLVLQLAAGGVAEFIVLDKFVALSKLILRFLKRYKTSLLRKHLQDVLVRSLELT